VSKVISSVGFGSTMLIVKFFNPSDVGRPQFYTGIQRTTTTVHMSELVVHFVRAKSRNEAGWTRLGHEDKMDERVRKMQEEPGNCTQDD
jgi:hypothetical protein